MRSLAKLKGHQHKTVKVALIAMATAGLTLMECGMNPWAQMPFPTMRPNIEILTEMDG